QIIGEAKMYDYFGTNDLSSNSPGSMTVRSLTKCELLVLHKRDYALIAVKCGKTIQTKSKSI
ncbi:MAG: hypothetical protein MHPSP_001439, partial [Paramarteilia canceri]